VRLLYSRRHRTRRIQSNEISTPLGNVPFYDFSILEQALLKPAMDAKSVVVTLCLDKCFGAKYSCVSKRVASFVRSFSFAYLDFVFSHCLPPICYEGPRPYSAYKEASDERGNQN